MDREEIKQFLPHREPMLLVDEVYVDPEGVCHATYTIPVDAFYCQGHFPGNAIVPGVILCEIMAQSCGALMRDVLQENLLVYRGLDNVKFRGTVRPGDRCTVTARMGDKKGSLTTFETSLSVDGHCCCRALITLAALPK